MRILYIYHVGYGRFKKYKLEMEKLGNEVSAISCTDIKKITPEHVKNYDLIWLLSPQYISSSFVCPETINFIKSKGIPLVTYSDFSSHVLFSDQDYIWRLFDFFFSQSLEFAEYLKESGVNTYYIPIGFYPDQYYVQDNKKTMGISFAGNISHSISYYLTALDDYDIKKFGTISGDCYSVLHPDEVIPYFSHKEQREIYSRSKVNLDIPFVNGISIYDGVVRIKNRFFEVPAMKQFLLTLRTNEHLSIFGEDSVGYYNDIPSMREAVSKYLKDDMLRKKMSETAYKEVMSKHTFSHRFKEMFQIIWES